jgi:hypothetical protein
MGVPSIGSPPARLWVFGEDAGSSYHEGGHAGKEMTHAIIRSKKGRRHEVDFGDGWVRAEVYTAPGPKID